MELETLIARRATDLVHQLDTSDAGARNNGLRGQVLVQFFERKRKKTGWFLKGEEDVCWGMLSLRLPIAFVPELTMGRAVDVTGYAGFAAHRSW